MPPTAAPTGRMAFFTVESCPTIVSRFISRPTTKNNRAINPSLIQWPHESANFESFQVKPIFESSSRKYRPDHCELAQVTAAMVQISSRMLPVASDLKNRADARSLRVETSAVELLMTSPIGRKLQCHFPKHTTMTPFGMIRRTS